MHRINSWILDTLFLTIVLSMLFFIMLGQRPLFTPDEGRYAEIAREMVSRGDYITPYLNGIKYFEKPALFYWLAAAAIKLGGPSIIAVRSINAVLAIFGCLLTYGVGRKLYDRKTGLTAAILLGTSTLYFVMAHMVSLDLPVTVFLAASLYGFLLAVEESDRKKARAYLYSAAVGAAFAVLTKGLIGAVFPAMIAAVWLTIMGSWRRLLQLPVISAFLIFLFIAAPWHILVNNRNPEFFHFYFIEQHFLRYTTMEVGHYQPNWFFIPTIIAGFFPWIVFLPQALTFCIPRTLRQRRQYSSELFFIVWAGLIFLFFSFSKSKLIPYILPVMPALAILTARYLVSAKKAARGLVFGYIAFFLFSTIITVFLWNLAITLLSPANATLYLRIATLPLILGSALALFSAFRSPQRALIITMISTAIFLVISLGSVRFIDTRTIRPLTLTLKPLLKPSDEIITYNQYYQDLPFYLEQRVTILNWRNELTFGMQHQNTSDWMINNDQFWQRWRSNKRVYMIMSREELKNFRQRYPREKIILITETPYNVLVSNRPLAIPPS